MKQTVFNIDGFKGAYIGYTFGDRWNGWACPYFEFAEAERIMHNSDGQMTYDKDTDTFTFIIDEDNMDSWQGFDRDGKHLYGIGAYSWVWDDMADWINGLINVIEEVYWEQDKEIDEVALYKALKNVGVLSAVTEIMYDEDYDYKQTYEKLEVVFNG